MADVVCIHADLTRENRGMINADAVAAMKPGAYVINTARGPICDTAALLAGLKSGKLARRGTGRAAEGARRHGGSARRRLARQRAVAARPRDTRPARRLLQPGRLRGPAQQVRGDGHQPTCATASCRIASIWSISSTGGEPVSGTWGLRDCAGRHHDCHHDHQTHHRVLSHGLESPGSYGFLAERRATRLAA